MATRIFLATLVCGIVDIIYAITMGVQSGGTASGVLQSVASGPFGNVTQFGAAGAALGLVVHFAITASMAFVLAIAFRSEILGNLPIWLIGVGYGLILYAVMHWIVLPLRWPEIFPKTGAKDVSSALFAHILLVGLPMAFMLRGLGQAQVLAESD